MNREEQGFGSSAKAAFGRGRPLDIELQSFDESCALAKSPISSWRGYHGTEICGRVYVCFFQVPNCQC